MLTQHKNALLRVIEESGLETTLFASEEQDVDKMGFWASLGSEAKQGQPVFIIEVKNTPLKFFVRATRMSFDELEYKRSVFRPGYDTGDWSRKLTTVKVLAAFKNWLNDVVKRYIADRELPDYWAQLGAYQSFLGNADAPPKESADFTPEEKETARQSIRKFRQLLKENFKPTPAQEVFINERLEYLSKAVDRLNRFDWKGLAFSTLVSIALNLSVDTERGRYLFSLFRLAFQEARKFLK